MKKSDALKIIEQRLLWLSHWMIHNANNIRPKADGIKVGGHQASSASMVSIMTALYFSALRPEDRVAVKPHASPVFHAMQYLMGNQTQQNMENFRGLGGVQSYPSRTKDVDDVDFSTGSVGLGVGITSFASLVQDFIAAKSWGEGFQPARMVALVGDAELDEGNIYETLQEGWKNDLRNCWWIIDYNRQSLDGVVREGLFKRIEKIFDTFGWDVVTVKYGVLQRAAFEEPGGQSLREWIDNCPNQLYSALTFMGGAVWRKRLMDDLGDQGDVTALIERRSDDELADLMENLGGNCVTTMADVFDSIDHDRPTCFLAYTVKGWGTPIAGHKDNHGGLMTSAQFAEWQVHMGVAPGEEWDAFATVEQPDALKAFLSQVPFFSKGRRRHGDARLPVPTLAAPDDREISTQAAFGKILDHLARGDSELAARILTTSPDVTGTTSLGPWVNRRKLFARQFQEDVFRRENIPSTAKWEFAPEGQHLELGIAEMNLFLLLGAAGTVAFPVRQEAHPHRHRVRPVRGAWPRCAQLCLLPGCAVHDRRHAVGRHACAGRRCAPVNRLASHWHVAGWAGSLRTGLCRRTRRDHGMGLRLHAARWRGRSGRAHMVARRDWRVSLPAVDHQPHRAAGQAGGRNFPAGHHRRGLLAEGTRTQLRRGDRLPGCGGTRGHQGSRHRWRRPARRWRAGGYLGGPAERRLDRGTTRAGPRQRCSAGTHRDATGRTAPAYPHCHRH
jgi:transketolase N-terminal domain/subunit